MFSVDIVRIKQNRRTSECNRSLLHWEIKLSVNVRLLHH